MTTPGCPGASSAGAGAYAPSADGARARLIVPCPEPPGVRPCPPPRPSTTRFWDAHLVHEAPDGTCLIYIDRHLVHEVTSPQAFEGLRMARRPVRAPEKTVAVPDHNVPTTVDRANGIDDPESRIQVDTLKKNAEDFGIEYYGVEDVRQGIVHIIGPEQGWTQPGMTIVCGDSHTATHGAFGALAHGIGTSEVEHVLATQTLIQRKAQEHAGRGEGQPRAGGDGQGHHAVDHRRDRDGGRHRACDRILRRGDPGAVDGRPDDGLQHGDRGRRAGRADRAGRDHVRLCAGPAEGAEGRGLGAGGGELAAAVLGRGRAVRQGGGARRRRDRAGGDLGHLARGRAADHRRGAAAGGLRGRQGRGGAALARLHGADPGHSGSRTSRSTRCSSGPARTGGSRTCGRSRR